jgi:superfamily II DNA or RNA helicase
MLGARRFYGFTATIDRVDGLRPLTHHFLGPVRYTVTRAQLVEADRSVEPEYRQIPTAFDFPYEARSDWAPLLTALANDAERNRQIVDLVLEHGEGELVAVSVGHVAHAEALAALLCANGLKASAMTGTMPKKARASILEDAREGRLDVVVGTQLLDEGIDIPILSRVILAWPSRAEGRFVQRVGRALRVHEGKTKPLILDLVDLNVGPLCNQARLRRAAFRKNFAPISVAA